MSTYAPSVTEQKIAEPYNEMFERIGGKITSAVSKYRPYPGEFLSPIQDEERAALDLRRENLPLLSGMGTDVINLGRETAQGRFLTADSNPYLADYAKGAIAPIKQELFYNALPRITSQSMERGSYGGIRPQLTKLAATDVAMQRAGDITSKVYGDAYKMERGFQQLAPTLLTQGAALSDMEATQLSLIGASERSFEQNVLSNDISKWYEKYMGPIQAMSAAAPAINTIPRPTIGISSGGMGGGSIGGQPSGGGWKGAATGALTGAAAGAMAGSVIPGIGTLIGAGIGAILGGALGY